MRDRVARWCLPIPTDVAVRLATWTGVGAPAVGAIAAGKVGLVAALIVVGVTAVLLGRTAPARRTAAYERALPEVLERVARHLRSGGNLAQAAVAAAPALERRVEDGGVGQEWHELVHRIPAVGAVAAFDAWARSAATPRSGRLAGAALALAAETGGSSARAVDGVAATLRARAAVADEIRALSSQSRASAVVIAVAPLGFALLASATDDRTAAFFASPAGLVIAAVGLALDALGAWWMIHLCRPPAP